jgi:hypothetical protein
LFQGALLCALVVLFSLAAKVSWYRVHTVEHPASISKMKAFKAKPAAVVPSSDDATTVPVIAVPVVLTLAALLLYEMATFEGSREVSASAREVFRRVSVARPPPTRQA